MYFSASHTRQYVSDLLSQLSATTVDPRDLIDIFILPDHVTIMSTINQLQGSRILCGAQDTFCEDEGAFTGEVSPAVLAEIGARIVMIGHAERRRIFGETDEVIAKKAAAVSRNGMIPLVCIGEKVQGSTASAAVSQCQDQIEAVLKAVSNDAEVILAYEPVWAIGAAEPAAADYINGVTSALRQLPCVRERAASTRIIYGGSAGPGLFEMLKNNVDGLFLARFGHDPAQFLKTIQEVATS